MAMAMVQVTAPLSDDQVEKLLQEAEDRLRGREQDRDGKSLVTQPVESKQLMKASQLDATTPNESKCAVPAAGSKSENLAVRVPERTLSKKEKAERAKAYAGAWFNLPRTNLTPELKRDLQLLRMRDVLDPKRHYRKDATKGVPEYSQVGTLIEGPAEFFSARMTKKERKRTLLEEVLETEDTTRRFKNKYGEIQDKKRSGKKADYKKMTERRYGKKK